ncbi:MAG: hypothetical protein IKO23_09860 [Bacteroidales bacterium]|nr:hypothetical protein [Bacteroidales bacterium]
MEKNLEKATGLVFGIVFAVCAATTLFGIIFKHAYWHWFTLAVTALLSVFFFRNAIKGE